MRGPIRLPFPSRSLTVLAVVGAASVLATLDVLADDEHVRQSGSLRIAVVWTDLVDDLPVQFVALLCRSESKVTARVIAGPDLLERWQWTEAVDLDSELERIEYVRSWRVKLDGREASVLHGIAEIASLAGGVLLLPSSTDGGRSRVALEVVEGTRKHNVRALGRASRLGRATRLSDLVGWLGAGYPRGQLFRDWSESVRSGFHADLVENESTASTPEVRAASAALLTMMGRSSSEIKGTDGLARALRVASIDASELDLALAIVLVRKLVAESCELVRRQLVQRIVWADEAVVRGLMPELEKLLPDLNVSARSTALVAWALATRGSRTAVSWHAQHLRALGADVPEATVDAILMWLVPSEDSMNHRPREIKAEVEWLINMILSSELKYDSDSEVWRY